MRHRRGLVFLASIFCAGTTALAAWLAQAPRPLDTTALRNAAQSREWPTYGGDYGERRYSSLNQINVSNVSRLGLAWSHVVGTGGGNQEATPLFWNGVLYRLTHERRKNCGDTTRKSIATSLLRIRIAASAAA
jgi:glucose dehydrogenase